MAFSNTNKKANKNKPTARNTNDKGAEDMHEEQTSRRKRDESKQDNDYSDGTRRRGNRNRDDRNDRNERNDRRRDYDREDEDRNDYRLFSDDEIFDANGGDELNAFLSVGNELFKENSSKVNGGGAYAWHIIGASARLTGYKLDAALLCQTVKELNSILVTVVMFEPRSSLPRQEAFYEDRKEMYSAIPNDQWTKSYRLRIHEIIERNLGVGPQIIDVGVVTIPHSYDISMKDDASKASIRRAVNYIATNSNYRAKDFTPGVTRFTLSDELLDNVDIVSKVLHQDGDIQDEFGQPIRSDIRVEVGAEHVRSNRDRRNYRTNSLENNADMKIGAISAYVDLAYVDDDNKSNRRSDRYRMYDINLHITSLTSEHRNTLESQLLVLANTPLLIGEGVLGRALMPMGEMGYLRNPAVIAMDMDDDFTPIPEDPSTEEWKDIIDTVVREGTSQIFLHIPETGLVTTIQDQMIAAADEDHPDHDTALNEIDQAAIRLTDGEYNIDDAPEFATIDPRQILLGTMTDVNGVVRDLREVQDYLTVGTFFSEGEDLQLEQERWESAQYAERIDSDFRLAMTESIVGQITDKRYRVQDRAVVIAINPDWLYYLSNCIARAGLVINAEGMNEEFRGRRGGSYRSRYENDGYRGNLFRRGRGRGGRGRGRGRDY